MGTKLEQQFEGLQLRAYPDPGTGAEPWTIGYGHTKGVKEHDECTQSQAQTWLMEDLQEAIAAVHAEVKVTLTQEEEDALVDFVFNAGAGNFEHSTLLRKLNSGDHEGAAQQFLLWDKAGGRVLSGLLRRRMAEKALFESRT